MPALVVALFLVGHGLIHASFLSPALPAKPGAPTWPFNVDAYLGFAPASWFAPAIVMGSMASLAVLTLFFSPWLLLGFVIDSLLLWAVLINGWAPKGNLRLNAPDA